MGGGMRLRNKKTGEIKEFALFDGNELQGGVTLEILTKEWEDAPEEPKGIQCIYYVNHFDTVKLDGVIVGFGSKEEAELAVRKLKAWTRLEDKGFRFTAWKNGIFLDGTIAGQVRYEFPIDNKDDIEADLDLLFSGEDD